jgi:hypothetical protein
MKRGGWEPIPDNGPDRDEAIRAARAAVLDAHQLIAQLALKHGGTTAVGALATALGQQLSVAQHEGTMFGHIDDHIARIESLVRVGVDVEAKRRGAAR